MKLVLNGIQKSGECKFNVHFNCSQEKKIQRTNLNCSFDSNRLLQLQFELQ